MSLLQALGEGVLHLLENRFLPTSTRRVEQVSKLGDALNEARKNFLGGGAWPPAHFSG